MPKLYCIAMKVSPINSSYYKQLNYTTRFTGSNYSNELSQIKVTETILKTGQNNAIIDCKFHLLDNFMNGLVSLTLQT
ncbi:hypothetical protein T10_10192 [Trichinella papuae]|uniref:Uncharacterized protein n=1 Tax=Trichinella papuae TaxID=268474 RepID=A0A0V1MIT2_9BILA|nr:hypothetical protein T10_10192 [Trichinella papuae]